MTDFPDIKIKALVNFPTNATGGAGIDVEKQNGNFVIDLDYQDFAPPVGGIADAALQNALLWNSVTNSYVLAPISLIGSGGSVPEAPNDGVQYGRQALAWTPVTTGSAVLPAVAVPLIESGSGAVGISAKYAREDHVHPALAGGGGTPSNAPPIMDGVAAAGTATPYSREDHIHPTDTSRAPTANPTFTGVPAAPTAAPATNTTQIATTAFVTAAVSGGTAGVASIGSKTGAITLNGGNMATNELPSPRYDVVQTLNASQQKQVRSNIGVNDANVIINGDFRINQVGYVSGAALTAPAYGHDQWKPGASGGDYSFTQLKSSTQITIAAGKSLIQPIEDVNVAGGSYVLSWTGTARRLKSRHQHADAVWRRLCGQSAADFRADGRERQCRSSSIPARSAL